MLSAARVRHNISLPDTELLHGMPRFSYDPYNENQVFSSLKGEPEFPLPSTELLLPQPELFSYEGSTPAFVRNIALRRAVLSASC
jgi:hypothetical protein